MATISFNTINDVNRKNAKNFDKLLNVKSSRVFVKIKTKKVTPSRILAIRKSMSER